MIKKIRDIYYALWADAINYERLKNGGGEHWKVFTFSHMSIILSLNIATLYSIILLITNRKITEFVHKLALQWTSSEIVAKFIWATVVLFIPSMIITYFLVFYKGNYQYILDNYNFKNGRYLLIYYVLTFVLLIAFSLLNKFFR